MSIYVPPSLSTADAVFNIAVQLEKLNSPTARKKIEEDIIAAHALNETEAKKLDEAKELIKKHSDILQETRRIADQTAQEKKDLNLEKTAFKEEMEGSNLKINARKSEVEDALQKATALNNQAIESHKLLNTREDELKRFRDDLEVRELKLKKDMAALDKTKSDIDSYKESVLALDKQTKAKVEKLKEFNF